jgi:hypothetical protein
LLQCSAAQDGVTHIEQFDRRGKTVMARQGCVFTDREIQTIVQLLKTEMSAQEIAARMGCSRSAVININRKFNIRVYAGRRTSWQMEERVNEVA